jgi:hypothetical protein
MSVPSCWTASSDPPTDSIMPEQRALWEGPIGYCGTNLAMPPSRQVKPLIMMERRIAGHHYRRQSGESSGTQTRTRARHSHFADLSGNDVHNFRRRIGLQFAPAGRDGGDGEWSDDPGDQGDDTAGDGQPGG